eukprot:gnl/TRDRNA2_/TRDRNA2_157968_c0_seq9.p1 gnl/TRDRNA2_/TRDRNA2_157968_c0~~gnl/TRDRNA2_/TRDRNA2_157968_c0_seq9.p1  ORF type:complete len:691 (-),score=268.79 gnl/TRDRNA2_/TRDRNA2_157968_c0_seq9:83-2155(-)
MWAAFAAVTVLLAATSADASRVTVKTSVETTPLTKVVNLLTKMKEELEKAADEDKESWESIKCWCDTNEATKTKAIDDANSHITSLENIIQESAAKKAELSTEIDILKKDIAENKEALAEATKLRGEQNAEFHTTEKNLIKNIGLLKGAITALSNQHAEFMQDGQVKPVSPMLRKMIHDNLDRFSFLKNSPDRDAFLSFINARDDLLEPDLPASSFLQLPYKSYAPASGQIFGVLKQMKEDMEADLPEEQKDEQKKAADFAELKGAKEAEIKNQQEAIDQKSTELGQTKELLTNSKKDLEDTSAELSADRKFMLQLTERCTQAADEWEKRKKMRADEISAVSGAISILTADNVRDASRGTFKSFLQLSATKADEKRAYAVKALSNLQVKTKYAGAEVQALVETAKLEPMQKVTEGIDKLVAKLKVQQADEVKQKDYCIDALHENKVQTERKYAHKESLVADIADLTATHDTLEKEIESLKNEIADLKSQQQGAGENRVKESMEFQKTMRDQMTTKKALEGAYEKLAEFYHKKASLLQIKAKKQLPTVNALGEVDSPKFKEYNNNSGNMDAMGLIKKFIGDAKILMDEALFNEQKATEAYTEFLQDTNDSIKAKSKLQADKQEELAETDQTIEEKTLERDETLEAIQGLDGIKKDLHEECDFLMENFTKRQEARLAEMDSLGEVKAILTGA